MDTTTRTNHVLQRVEAGDVELHLSRRVRTLAGKGLVSPGTFCPTDIVALCGAVMRHIENHDSQQACREIHDAGGDFA